MCAALLHHSTLSFSLGIPEDGAEEQLDERPPGEEMGLWRKPSADAA